jgi:4-amino-4-deoxy-L-arabinose transferase-like glycosyltransferase
MAVAAIVLFVGLEGTPMRPYDEGLYGRLARNAIAHDTWTYAVESDGSFSTKFSKPPLSLWLTAASFRALGPSMLSLRLPFALAMAMGIGICTAWGIRARGLRFGLVWGATLTLCGATLRWGRYASIEPMFVAFGLLALWGHAEAIGSRGARRAWWALLAGLGLSLAFLTKQLAVGAFVLPMLVVEATHRVHARPRRLRRWGLAFGTPVVLGGAWLWGAYRRVGEPLVDTFFVRSIGGRIAGFEEGINQRSLNEVASIVSDVVAPFPWVLGFVVVLAATRWPASESDASDSPPRDRLLMTAMAALLVTATVLYDTAARTLLPWYAFAFVPGIAAGIAWAIDHLADASASSPARDWLVAGAGAATLAFAVVVSARPWTSELTVALVLGAAAIIAVRGGLESTRRREAIIAAAMAFVLVGTLHDDEFRQGPGPLERLMRQLGARDLQVVAVDRNTGADQVIEYAAYFGPRALSVRSAPWRQRDLSGIQAYVTAELPPEELVVPSGIELLRVDGAVAVVGDLSVATWSPATTDALLAAGPITFEAEHLPSQRVETLQRAAAEASGEGARAVVPRGTERIGQFLLTQGPGWRLPAGSYRADYRVKWTCPGKGTKVARLWVAADDRELAKVDLDCEAGDADGWQDIGVPFRLTRTTRVDLRVVYVAGAVWHDLTRVTLLSR